MLSKVLVGPRGWHAPTVELTVSSRRITADTWEVTHRTMGFGSGDACKIYRERSYVVSRAVARRMALRYRANGYVVVPDYKR